MRHPTSIELTAVRKQDLGAVNQSAPPEAKIALFRSLFRGREDVYPRRFENRRIGKTGETAQQTPTDRAEDDSCSFRVFGDLCAGVFDFGDKRGAKPSAFSFVELSGLIELSFRQRVERDGHSLQPISGVPQNLSGWPGSRFVPCGIPPLRFLSPEVRVGDDAGRNDSFHDRPHFRFYTLCTWPSTRVCRWPCPAVNITD